jgi:hypothetical protein
MTYTNSVVITEGSNTIAYKVRKDKEGYMIVHSNGDGLFSQVYKRGFKNMYEAGAYLLDTIVLEREVQ